MTVLMMCLMAATFVGLLVALLHGTTSERLSSDYFAVPADRQRLWPRLRLVRHGRALVGFSLELGRDGWGVLWSAAVVPPWWEGS